MSISPASDLRFRVPERHQVALSMGCIDDLLAADHPARMIWQMVAQLDLQKFHAPIKARKGVSGRDPTDPRLLTALWVYAATDGVGSARELARLCQSVDAYKWLCGGLRLNHHTLSDFRVGHGDALDTLLTQIITLLVDKELVTVYRISQDGTRVRACCGSATFRRKEKLQLLLGEARRHVAELRRQLDDPAYSAALGARKKAAMERSARQRRQRIEEAIAQLPELEARQADPRIRPAHRKRFKAPRASTTDAEARLMRMPDGGYRPAVNVQLAVDVLSRAVVGVEVMNHGSDLGRLEPMRKQVEQRTKRKVKEHLADGGYTSPAELEAAAKQQVKLYVPPRPPFDPERAGQQFIPRSNESPAMGEWRARMGQEGTKEIYHQRGSTVETVNADLKTHRGLVQLTVRGLARARCVVLWSVLAYNLLHFGRSLLA